MSSNIHQKYFPMSFLQIHKFHSIKCQSLSERVTFLEEIHQLSGPILILLLVKVDGGTFETTVLLAQS